VDRDDLPGAAILVDDENLEPSLIIQGVVRS
jgi:hypothetical protein